MFVQLLPGSKVLVNVGLIHDESATVVGKHRAGILVRLDQREARLLVTSDFKLLLQDNSKRK